MRISFALFALVAIAAIACSNPTSANDLCANSGAVAVVDAADSYTFTPSTVAITVGQSVCWANTGSLTHTVTVPYRFSGNLPAGQTFVYTFTFGGSFAYHCSNHSNMTGTVVVNCKPGDLVC